METKSNPPSTSAEFNKVYSSCFAHWVWTDIRIPKELKELVANNKPKSSLELGCGLGRFSTYMAAQGILATGVDFSDVAIKKATEQLADKKHKPTLLVGDVTNLNALSEPFDVAFDVGCFHCLNEDGQRNYVAQAYRLLKPGSTLLIWALDRSPSEITLSPDYMSNLFANRFRLVDSKFSRRRIIASHWYWLVR